MDDPQILPIATVQTSFKDVISEVNEGLTPQDTFWVSCYHFLKPSIHTKVQVWLDDHDRDLVLLKAQDGKVDVKMEAVSLVSSLNRCAYEVWLTIRTNIMWPVPL